MLDSKDVLNDISFEVNDSELVGLVGPSGSGKTTIFQHFTGLLKPTAGKIYVDGKDINLKKYSIRELRKRIGLVFQFPESQLFEESVKDDIAFGLKSLNLSTVEIQERVSQSLSVVGMNQINIERRSPHQLSEGEKRRVALAGILAMSPKMLILDEPTAGLDPAGTKLIINILQRLNKEGTTILMITHNTDLIFKLAQRFILLNKGKIMFDGPREDVLKNQLVFKQANLEIPAILKFCFYLFKKKIIPDWRIYSVAELKAILKRSNAAKQ